jgi:hypothetical protein
MLLSLDPRNKRILYTPASGPTAEFEAIEPAHVYAMEILIPPPGSSVEGEKDTDGYSLKGPEANAWLANSIYILQHRISLVACRWCHRLEMRFSFGKAVGSPFTWQSLQLIICYFCPEFCNHQRSCVGCAVLHGSPIDPQCNRLPRAVI